MPRLALRRRATYSPPVRACRPADRRASAPSWLAVVVALVVAACGSTAPRTHHPAASSGVPAAASGIPGNATGTPGGGTSGTGVPGTGAPGASALPTQAPVAWSDCGNGFECGSIEVPRDYAEPAGPALRLALIRLPAGDPAHRIGSLVVNPGGPGISGVDFVRAAAATLFPAAIRARFDIVGFDPRGVGASSPVRCVDGLDHFIPVDARAETSADLSNLVAGAKAFAAGCGQNDAALLPYLSTANVARDLDQIRAALGDPRLTYLGFSYGTLIGEMYASLFPTRIRALVLDGAIDPSLGEAAFREGQARGFEGALGRLLADCGAHPTCPFYSGGRPAPAFDALMRRIDAHPLPTPQLAGREPTGPTQAWQAVLEALYTQAAWPILEEALAQAEQGDGSLLLAMGDPYRGRLPDGGYSNEEDAYYAVTCLDWPAPRSLAAYASLAGRFSLVAPRFGRLLAYNDVDCAFWPSPPERTPAPIAAPGAPPIVVVGTTGDPATPYQWAVNVSHQLRSAVLLTRRGEGHTAYGESACIDAAVDAYLLDRTTPRPGLVCP